MTAVEWFAEKDGELTIQYLEGKINGIELAVQKTKCFHQALAMEKQQIIEANEDCSTNELGELFTGEQYYNETYNK
jgi:hypothetical protein